MTDLAPTLAPAFAPAPSRAAAARDGLDLRAEGLRKRYGDATVFGGVSFDLRAGEAVAIVGGNGTGKSTLLRCLLGLAPLDGGTAHVLGVDVGRAGRRERRAMRARVGLVSQKHNLVLRASVLTNVIHGLLGQRGGPLRWSQALAPAADREAGMAALEKVGLAHLARRRADRLSGGQSQRVAIARALVGGPRLLIADEPTASLDPAAGEDVMALFFRLAREQGVTVLFVSHNLAHALRYGDRVLGLAGGRLALDRPAAALAEADLRRLYG